VYAVSKSGIVRPSELTDTSEATVPPEKIFSFRTGLKDDESYKVWHPDHIVLRWIGGEPFQEGSVVYFEEYLHEELHKAKSICTNVVPTYYIDPVNDSDNLSFASISHR
jgi:hypothetical protein